MENLSIEETKYTPKIYLDAKNQVLEFRGKSTPENTFEFYEPAIEWIKAYFAQANTVKVIFDIPYFNSSSSRVLYDIFDLLDEAHSAGSTVKISWLYAQGNENALETGEEFKEDFEDLDIVIESF